MVLKQTGCYKWQQRRLRDCLLTDDSTHRLNKVELAKALKEKGRDALFEDADGNYVYEEEALRA